MKTLSINSPDLSLLCKVASIVVHAEEMLSADGHHFDRTALELLLKDNEVKNWLVDLSKIGLVPKKRKTSADCEVKHDKA